ncbi:hypothetical protein AA313_de0206726 [Arthrobotrys entomopaga]|nr:hypothetical protein AA313_de0206726 [Arthrobotrys entomopaga]
MDRSPDSSLQDGESSQKPLSYPGTSGTGFLMRKNKIKASLTNLSTRLNAKDTRGTLPELTLTQTEPARSSLPASATATISSTDPEIITMTSSENSQLVVSVEGDTSVALNLTTTKVDGKEKTDGASTHCSNEEVVLASTGSITPTISTIMTSTAPQQQEQEQEQEQQQQPGHSVHPISKETQEIIDLIDKLVVGETTIDYKMTNPAGYYDPDPECNEFLASLSPEDRAIAMGLPPPGQPSRVPKMANTPPASPALSRASVERVMKKIKKQEKGRRLEEKVEVMDAETFRKRHLQ